MSRFTTPYAPKQGTGYRGKKRSENAQPQNEILCSKGAWGIPNKQRQEPNGYPGALLATMVTPPKKGGEIALCGGPHPSYNGREPDWRGIAWAIHARFGKLSAGPPIAAFDLRRLRSGQQRTLVSQSKLNGSGQRRAPV